MATDRRIALEFTAWTFGIAAVVSGALIVAGRYGYTVHNWVGTPQQLLENLPFSIYILSPAIASYGVLRYRGRVSGPREWLATVFHVRTSPVVYAYVLLVLAVYFLDTSLCRARARPPSRSTPFCSQSPETSSSGASKNRAGTNILQPQLDSKLGYMVSSLLTSFIWLGWHVPLFFIPWHEPLLGRHQFLDVRRADRGVPILLWSHLPDRWPGQRLHVRVRSYPLQCRECHIWNTSHNVGRYRHCDACVLALAIAAVVVNACWDCKTSSSL